MPGTISNYREFTLGSTGLAVLLLTIHINGRGRMGLVIATPLTKAPANAIAKISIKRIQRRRGGRRHFSFWG